jgi:hypothetical protein
MAVARINEDPARAEHHVVGHKRLSYQLRNLKESGARGT